MIKGPEYAFVINGGFLPQGLSKGIDLEIAQERSRALRHIADQTSEQLASGASAKEAAIDAVALLESDPVFAAGVGGAFRDGLQQQSDAGYVDGKTHEAYAVVGVTDYEHPILVAQNLIEPGIVYGKTANEIARVVAEGDDRQPVREWPSQGYSQRSYLKWGTSEAGPESVSPYGGMVGAVVWDGEYSAVAASSSGYTGDPIDRITEAGMPGDTYYAGYDGAAMVSGQNTRKMLASGLARDLVGSMYHNMRPEQKADVLLGKKDVGGIVVVNRRGEVGAVSKGSRLIVASMTPELSAPRIQRI